MHKQLLCGASAIAIVASIDGTSLAADLPLKAAPLAPVAARMTWAGWYIGGHIGWGGAHFDGYADHSGDLFPINDKPHGLVGGLHGGYNWQHDSFVFGIEGDISAAGLDKTTFRTNGGSQPCQSGENAACSNMTVNALASLRARLGMAFDRTLLYVTGGLGYAHGKGLASFGTTAFGSGKFNAWGAVAGAGVEWKQSPSFSWRLEGLWYGFNKTFVFGNHDSPPTNFATMKLKDVWTVRLGATHHF
jgi:outer membrane immunogenic protein